MKNNIPVPKKVFIEVGKAYKKGRIDGISFTVQNYSAVMLLCLKDKFGFTTDQLIDVKTYVNDAFDSVGAGYVTLNDISDTLNEENDINLTFNKEAVLDE